jgi:hypothetical protein
MVKLGARIRGRHVEAVEDHPFVLHYPPPIGRPRDDKARPMVHLGSGARAAAG